MFGSSGLLTIPQVVRTSPVVIFVRQVTPSAAITGSLCTCVFSALAVPGPVQKSSASSSSFSLQVTEEFVNCRVTFLSQSCRLRTRQKLGAVSPRDSAGCFFVQERYIFIQGQVTPGTDLDYLSLGYFQPGMQLHLSKWL